MSKILGKNVTLSILIAGSPSELKVIGCGRTCTLITNVQTAGKSTTGSGTWQEFKAIVNSWSVTADGIATVDENLSIADLRALQFTLTPVVISFKEVIGATTIYYSGYALIVNVQTAGNYNDVETYNVQLQGTGELIQGTGDIYGNYPNLFYLASVAPDTPIPGQTTLGFTWSAANPAADSYTIRIHNYTTNTTTFDTGIVTTGHSIVVDSASNYSFAVKSVYIGLGSSIYSPSIVWP